MNLNFKYRLIARMLGTIAFTCLAVALHAQQADRELEDILAGYEKSDNVRFFYKKEWIRDVRASNSRMPLKDFLNSTLSQHRITYSIYQERYIILFPVVDPQPVPLSKEVENENFSADNNTYTITGHILDANSGEAIIGASIQVDELRNGTVTNVSGFFTLRLKSGVYNLTISAIGKTPITKRIALRRNETIELELYEKVVQLKDVVVTAESMEQQISSPTMSSAKLTASVMRKLPAFMGEVDVIKSIRLLPGVTTVGEGAGGFNVRGGNVDQNLVLMDDAPIFNSSHLFGFFSTFNSDVVKMSHYKKAVCRPNLEAEYHPFLM
jgi:hypothetical protein